MLSRAGTSRPPAKESQEEWDPMSVAGPLAAGAAIYFTWKALTRPKEMDLEDRVVLITGGSRGLGLALARAFAAAGSRVVICGRDRRELARAAEDLDSLGADGLALPCDVTDQRDVHRMFRRVERRVGPVEVLVNNAGMVQVGPLSSFSLADFRAEMEANFWGAVHTTLEALPGMRERGEGRIVNITSIGGKMAVPHLLPYTCSKFAEVGFSEGLRAELAREGIAVTTVVPGLMRTGGPAHARFRGDAEREYAWFTVLDATSATATSATRAAKRIVRATRKGEAEVTLTWQAKLARLAAGLFPGLTANAMGIGNRILPEADGREKVREGLELRTPVAPSALTRQMNRAARDLNQYGGTEAPAPDHARAVGLEEDGA